MERAQDWRWSSLGGCAAEHKLPLAAWPVDKPRGWTRIVNDELEKAALASLRTSVQRGRPFGVEAWVAAAARRLNLASTLRPVGRPPSKAKEAK